MSPEPSDLPEPSLKGRLLVATPILLDPNFERTVVLLLEHRSEDGALGIVLNRPSETSVGEPLPAWEALAAPPAVLFVGGPVSPGSAIALGRGAADAAEGWEPVLGPVGTVDLDRDPALVRTTLDEVRVFAGYAGWAPGQLEGEIAGGSWFVVDAEPDDAFSADPGDLWPSVLRRQGGRLAMFAHCPPDPSVN